MNVFGELQSSGDLKDPGGPGKSLLGESLAASVSGFIHNPEFTMLSQKVQLSFE